MKIIDLSRTITPGMQCFPGDMTPMTERLEAGGFRTSNVRLCMHTGTHMDAPAHIISASVTLDMLPPETFWGLALLADVNAAAGRMIEISDIEPFRDELAGADFLLLRTGWEDKFGTPEYLSGFPTLSEDAARYAASLGVRGVGFDTISADRVENEDCPIHKTLLSAGVLIIENLRGLNELPEGETFLFATLPMPLAQAEGAPARVTAILEN